MSPKISEIEHDALTEIINMAVGRSAGALNEMVGQEVTLSVPRIKILGESEIATEAENMLAPPLTLVQQDFGGAISGLSCLAFPEGNSLELVRLILGEEISPNEIVDLEQEALQEVGNLVINSFLGTLANEFGVSISSDLPSFRKKASIENVFGKSEEGKGIILFIHVDFTLKQENISGYLILTVSVATMSALVELVKKYVALMT
ncbi:MAG: chemotaxis protein CheX [Alphaproteobacteria bacterium]|nr:chemotaxis protein CheX [Alphaproteobacteria bacterium]